MPFQDERMTYQNANIDITFVDLTGKLSEIISEEEFNLPHDELRKLIESRANKLNVEKRIIVYTNPTMMDMI